MLYIYVLAIELLYIAVPQELIFNQKLILPLRMRKRILLWNLKGVISLTFLLGCMKKHWKRYL
jgi:hypothetical protein